MENRRLSAMLRRIESSLNAIDNPQTCGANFDGSQRTISPTAKTRELEQLINKLAECRSLVSNETEQEWLNGVGETLKAKVMEVFNPPMLKA